MESYGCAAPAPRKQHVAHAGGGGRGVGVERFSGHFSVRCKTWNLDPRQKVETENHVFLTTFRPENVGLIFPNPTPKKLDGKVTTFPKQHRKQGLQDLKLEQENFDSCHNFFVLLFGDYKTLSECHRCVQKGPAGTVSFLIF